MPSPCRHAESRPWYFSSHFFAIRPFRLRFLRQLPPRRRTNSSFLRHCRQLPRRFHFLLYRMLSAFTPGHFITGRRLHSSSPYWCLLLFSVQTSPLRSAAMPIASFFRLSSDTMRLFRFFDIFSLPFSPPSCRHFCRLFARLTAARLPAAARDILRRQTAADARHAAHAFTFRSSIFFEFFAAGCRARAAASSWAPPSTPSTLFFSRHCVFQSQPVHPIRQLPPLRFRFAFLFATRRCRVALPAQHISFHLLMIFSLSSTFSLTFHWYRLSSPLFHLIDYITFSQSATILT